MTKTGVLLAIATLAACTADSTEPDGGGTVDSRIAGEWNFRFDATACGGTSQQVVGFVIADVDGGLGVTRWALHENFVQSLDPAGMDGGMLVLETTFGPYERYDLLLVDDGDFAAVGIDYSTRVGTEPCSMMADGENVTRVR